MSEGYPDPPRPKGRTPFIVSLLWWWGEIFTLFCIFGYFINFSIAEIFLMSVLTVIFYGSIIAYFGHILTKNFMPEEYALARKIGIPLTSYLLNSEIDSDLTACSGVQEPPYTKEMKQQLGFKDWSSQCPKCGARLPKPTIKAGTLCWYPGCTYGKNPKEDVKLFFERFPSELWTPSQWELYERLQNGDFDNLSQEIAEDHAPEAPPEEKKPDYWHSIDT